MHVNKTVKLFIKEIERLGGYVKNSSWPGGLYVWLPPKRVRMKRSTGVYVWRPVEVTGGIWPAVQQWEVLGGYPYFRHRTLRKIFKKFLPLWQEREKINFSTLVASPQRLPELYRPIPKQPNN